MVEVIYEFCKLDGKNVFLVVEPRLMRRVLRKHRGIFGSSAGSSRTSYVIGRTELLSICRAEELGPFEPSSPKSLADQVVLIARPDAETGDTQAQTMAVWRAAFRGALLLALFKLKDTRLTDGVLRERVHRIGQTEFDEIRTVLRQEEVLLPRAGWFETYAEFAALYLELRRFAPEAIPLVFPTLSRHEVIEQILSEGLSVERALDESRPANAPHAPPRLSLHERVRGHHVAEESPESLAAPSTMSSEAPSVSSSLGNYVRAALVHLRTDKGAARREIQTLLREVDRATRPEGSADPGSSAPFVDAFLQLANSTKGVRFTMGARLLYDLQRAAHVHGHPRKVLDFVTFFASFGGRPLIRTLLAEREVRVFSAIRKATTRLPLVAALDVETRKAIDQFLTQLVHRAEKTLRDAMRPEILAVLEEVGLKPESTIERVARTKLVEELLDRVVEKGHIDLPTLRDAISRNQLKLPDLSVRSLVFGDPLLRADNALSIRLDGVHRRGEIYLRILQRLSSLFFGTALGRLLSLWVLLPAIGSFVVLEGSATRGWTAR